MKISPRKSLRQTHLTYPLAEESASASMKLASRYSFWPGETSEGWNVSPPKFRTSSESSNKENLNANNRPIRAYSTRGSTPCESWRTTPMMRRRNSALPACQMFTRRISISDSERTLPDAYVTSVQQEKYCQWVQLLSSKLEMTQSLTSSSLLSAFWVLTIGVRWTWLSGRLPRLVHARLRVIEFGDYGTSSSCITSFSKIFIGFRPPFAEPSAPALLFVVCAKKLAKVK